MPPNAPVTVPRAPVSAPAGLPLPRALVPVHDALYRRQRIRAAADAAQCARDRAERAGQCTCRVAAAERARDYSSRHLEPAPAGSSRRRYRPVHPLPYRVRCSVPRSPCSAHRSMHLPGCRHSAHPSLDSRRPEPAPADSCHHRWAPVPRHVAERTGQRACRIAGTQFTGHRTECTRQRTGRVAVIERRRHLIDDTLNRPSGYEPPPTLPSAPVTVPSAPVSAPAGLPLPSAPVT